MIRITSPAATVARDQPEVSSIRIARGSIISSDGCPDLDFVTAVDQGRWDRSLHEQRGLEGELVLVAGHDERRHLERPELVRDLEDSLAPGLDPAHRQRRPGSRNEPWIVPGLQRL